MDARTILSKLWLSQNEIQIYLTTLALGQAVISTIAKKSGLKRTSNYNIIDKLCKEWILTHYTKNKIQYYSAIDPYTLLEKYKQSLALKEEAVKNFESIVPTLSHLQDWSSNNSTLHLFEWIEWLKAMYEDVIITCENKLPVHWLLCTGNMCESMLDYFNTSYIPRRENQISNDARVIVTESSVYKTYIENRQWYSKKNCKIINSSQLCLDVNIHVYWDKVGFYDYKDINNLYWILIESKTISSTMKAVIFALWEAY